MAGRTRNAGITAPATPQAAGSELGITPPKQVRRRRSTRSRNKSLTSTVEAASSATPYAGLGRQSASMGLATKGLMQYIVGRHAQGFNNAAIRTEFTAALEGWTG